MGKPENMIFGIRPIVEAIEAGKEINRIFLQKGLRGDLMNELKDCLNNTDIPIQYVPIEKLHRLTRKNHQGAVCFTSPIHFASIENVIPTIYEQGKVPLILVLDRLTDVRNFGSIVRTAECAGVDAIVIPAQGAASINADTIKVSTGSIFNIPICREKSLAKVVSFLQESGLRVAACSEKATDTMHGCEFKDPTAIIMGSEEDGISHELMKRTDYLVKIPMAGKTASLNVAMAAGIILFEVVRQRL